MTGSLTESPLIGNVHSQSATECTSDAGVVDYLVENQRGWVFLGFPFFSENSLLPWDPSNWTTLDKHASPGISQHLLPSVYWKWVWKRWYVDMIGDVDDQGWTYSWRFGASTWHGSHIWFNSFVRKRVWKRLRQPVKQEISKDTLTTLATLPSNISSTTHLNVRHSYIGGDEDPFELNREESRNQEELSKRRFHIRKVNVSNLDSSTGNQMHGSPIDSVESLITRVKSCRIDRERIVLIGHVIKHSTYDMLRQLIDRLAEVLNTFDFRDSTKHLMHHLQIIHKSNQDHARQVYIQEAMDAIDRHNSQTRYYSEDGLMKHGEAVNHDL